MNRSNINHALYALAFQLGAGIPLLLFGLGWALWLTGAFAVGFFLSREHAQQECQISLRTGRRIEDLGKLEGFRGWVRDRYLDAGCPLVACLVAAMILPGLL